MKTKTSFYSESELKKLGLKSFGRGVLISRKASFYNPEETTIGDSVRIDDFCILSGKITVGSYVHIAAYCGLFGRYGITIKDFTGVSVRVSIFSYSNDFLGGSLSNPMVPDEFTLTATKGPVILGRHVMIGCGSVILPNISIGDGVSVGALSLVKSDLKKWGIYKGIPAVYKTKKRPDAILALEKKFLAKYSRRA